MTDETMRDLQDENACFVDVVREELETIPVEELASFAKEELEGLVEEFPSDLDGLVELIMVEVGVETANAFVVGRAVDRMVRPSGAN